MRKDGTERDLRGYFRTGSEKGVRSGCPHDTEAYQHSQYLKKEGSEQDERKTPM